MVLLKNVMDIMDIGIDVVSIVVVFVVVISVLAEKVVICFNDSGKY